MITDALGAARAARVDRAFFIALDPFLVKFTRFRISDAAAILPFAESVAAVVACDPADRGPAILVMAAAWDRVSTGPYWELRFRD